MHSIRRAASVVAVSALLATGTVGAVAYNVSPAALPAAAAEVVTPPTLEGIPANANLHVHKVIGLPGEGYSRNGLEVDTSGLGEPAVGVTYTAYRVNQENGNTLSLATLAGWEEAARVDINSFFNTSEENPLQNLDTLKPSGDNPRLGSSSEATTNSSGTASFDNLATGLYLVVEENNPYSTVPGGNPVAVAPSAPFLVTVPLTDPEARESWLDTVHVYPKGQQFTSPQKRIVDPTTGETVDLTGTSVGDTIAYDVSTDIPNISTGTLPGLSITDKLPVEFGQGGVAEVRIGDQVLTNQTHYRVRNWTLEDDSEVIIVRLTQPGLDILGDGNKMVSVRFTAVLNAVPRTGLTNTAWFRRVEPTVNAPEGWDPEAGDGTPGNPLPGTPTNLVTSTYGEIVITKTSEEGPRAGAQFELRRCYSGGDNEGQVVENSRPIQIGTQTSWTTSDGSEEGSTLGSVTISGIHLSNTQPDEEGTAVTTSIWADEEITEYCLLETQAPEGYELLPEPYLLGDFTGAETEFKTVNVEIENVRANAGFNLPLTGGMGIWVALGGGALLLLIAAAYYAARNRKQA